MTPAPGGVLASLNELSRTLAARGYARKRVVVKLPAHKFALLVNEMIKHGMLKTAPRRGKRIRLFSNLEIST